MLMTKSTIKHRKKHVANKKQSWRFKLPGIAAIAFGIFVLLVGLGVAVSNFTQKPIAYAATSTTPGVQTFTTSYKGYNPGTAWMGWLSDSQRCSKNQTIYGAKPTTAGTYPTLIYLHGTTADKNSNKEGQRFVEKAAAQGFVAMAVTYDSSTKITKENLNRHAYCTFDQSRSGNAMTAICAIAGTTCSQGVLLSGFSQGAAIAVIAKNYNPQVKALWALGLSAYIYSKYDVPSDSLAAPLGNRALSNDKIVINMGEASSLSQKTLIPEDSPSLKELTGRDCANNFDCIQANGSGYYVVSNSEVKDGMADHCYWMMENKVFKTALSCTTSPTEFESGFQPPAINKWSMITNLNWLKAQL